MAKSAQPSTGTNHGDDDPGPRRVADVEVAKKDLRVLYRVIRDPETVWYVPLLMAGVFLWAIMPVDLLPDVFPLLGVLDEALVFMLCRAAVYRVVPNESVETHARSVAHEGRRRFTLTHLIGGIVVLQLSLLLLVVTLAEGWVTSLI